MRLMIDGGGYATAATSFAEANAVAALQHDHLVDALGGCAGMAGHDPVAVEFAAAYDDAAAAALAGYADLVTALATLGHLTEASLARHDDAERASLIPGSVVYEGGSLTPGSYASVLRATPPSSLAADATSLAPAQEWVLDQLEGIFLPSGDPAALRAAAQSWRTAAAGLTSLTGYADTATRGLQQQLSPEIPLALGAVADVSDGITDLATQYSALAEACDSFAANVEARREELLALLEELVQMAVEGALVSLGVGLLTGGLGAGASGTAFAARLAARYPRFAAAVTLFRTVAEETAVALRAARDALALRRARFVKYLTARIALRGERGAADFSAFLGRGFLGRHRPVGHLLEKHVGRTHAQLAERFASRHPPSFSSTFDDERHAEKVVRAVLRKHSADIRAWMRSDRYKLPINTGLGYRTGVSMAPDGTVADVTGVRLVLVRDENMREGWRILTGFPQPWS